MFSPWLTTPELQYLSPKDRMHWWNVARTQARLSRSALFWGLMIAFVGGLVPMFVLYEMIRDAIGGWAAVVMTLYGLIAGGVFNLIFRRRIRQAIRDRLDISYEERVMPCCIECGYSLDGCTESTQACPECGNPHIRGNPTPAVIRRYKFGF